MSEKRAGEVGKMRDLGARASDHGSGSAPVRHAGSRTDGPGGIVLADLRWASEGRSHPRISAFIWGGKVRPTPVLPYGRWKGAA